MPIFHLATAADWAAAQQVGRYTTSTRGRTLAEEGFVHASRADQWQGVRERYYADVTEPLVLLVIDPDRLGAPVVEESVPGSPAGAETFPHVYGAIEVDAVTRVIALDPAPAAEPTQQLADPAQVAAPAQVAGPATPQRTFWSLYLEEMAVRAAAGLAVIVVAVLVGLAVLALAGDLPALVTMAVLLAAGCFVVARLLRRRSERQAEQSREAATGPAGPPRADSQA